MALLHAMAKIAPVMGFSVLGHGIDHGLRGAAAGELDLARGVALGLDLPFSTTRVEVAPGANLQARARRARYEALEEAARAAGGALIATAHTADDRAETVLLRLLRGTGPHGLSVLPPRAGDRIRPIVRVSRADVLAHLARHRLPCAEDPSNRDPRYLRVRVRHELVPLLRSLSPKITEHLCQLADACAELRPETRPDLGLDITTLNAAQRRAIARAERLGRKLLDLRLAGGREVRLTLGANHRPRGGGSREGA
jgi:tRNA(Ile)-lysidine synthase